ncbi:MAG: ester cyclase [Spirochaetota bacterium]
MNNFDGLVYIARQLAREEKQALPGFDDCYHNFVDFIIKITYEIWEKKGIGYIYDTYADDVFLHIGLSTHRGIDKVISGTLDTLHAFPDRVPYGEEVIWSHSKGDKFFSSHRLGSTATHRGAHAVYGKPTDKQVFFRTMADCIISNNKVDEEWLVRDNYYVLQQLGLDPVELAKRSAAYSDNIGDKRTLRHENRIEPRSMSTYNVGDYTGENSAALVLSLFQEIYSRNYFNRLDTYYSETAVMHSICERRYCGISQIRDYFIAFFASIPNMEVIVDRITCNPGNAVDKVAVRWTVKGEHKNHGLFGPSSGKVIQVLGITHFEIVQGKIQEEWAVFDLFDVLCQIHAGSRDRAFPSARQGAAGSLQNKEKVLSGIKSVHQNIIQGNDLRAALADYIADDVVLNVSRPFDELCGLDAYHDGFFKPLCRSFRELEDRPYIVMGGEYGGNECVSLAGNFIGTFEREWLGIPPSQQPTWIRYQAHCILKDAKIIKIWYFLDVLDVIHQAGFSLLPQRGAYCTMPAPMTGDGIITYPVASTDSEISLRLVSDMLDALCSYDGKNIASMGDLTRYWHEQDMMWYGPSGIGTTKGLQGFQKNHQFPFLQGFPDRGILPKDQQEHFASYADGNYVCDFGFPSMYATHTGDAWLGLAATGKSCTMRVMDFWRREGSRLVENWVMIDIIDVLEQLGVDVFARLQEAISARKN